MCRRWITEVRAFVNGEIILFHGPVIEGLTKAHAQRYCEENGLGYCLVTDECTSEIPCKSDTFDPDWEGAIFYSHEHLN